MSSISKIIVEPYNVNWLKAYTEEKNQIYKLLPHSIFNIHHIGSTSIKGMAAKPIIDILLELNHLDDIQNIEVLLAAIGYSPFGRSIICGRSFIARKASGPFSYNLHIFERGDPQVERHVNFSDYLNAHKAVANDYLTLKIKLSKKYEHDLPSYLTEKPIWSKKLMHSLDSVPTSALNFRRVLDYQGCQDYANILTNDPNSFKQYFTFLSNLPLHDNDPIELYVGYSNGKPVVRCALILYAGVAGLQFLSTASDERNKGYATAMQSYIITRAKNLGYQILTLQSAPEALNMYQKQGWDNNGIFREFKEKPIST